MSVDPTITRPHLQVCGLHKTFHSGGSPLEVLNGVDLQMEAGDQLAVTGPSGSGKSTLLYIIGTLDQPTAGDVLVEGLDPFGRDEAGIAEFRNSKVGFVFQDHHLLPQYSVLENTLLPTVAFKGTPDGEERARALLDRVGLGHRLEHRPAELSGGERQRVAIARALINQPGLLLCDEPTGNLDGPNADTVADLLLELHAEASSVLLVVTHSPRLAERFGRRIDLENGRCVER